jgi:ubiquinone/menaquinone biosynthesis C-methylase UbiE
MLDPSDYQMAPCLQVGPLANQASQLVSVSRALGSSRWASVLRAWCVPYLFVSLENIFASDKDPVDSLNLIIEDLSRFMEAATESGYQRLDLGVIPGSTPLDSQGDEIEKITGEHYGRLFESFSNVSFWDEPVSLLRDRLVRNEVQLADLAGKDMLDAGCGGGRYTVAWRLLVAQTATGIDISEVGLADAQRRVDAASIDGVLFRPGNVLNLPFDDNSFDIVFSNGVLHHTVDWKQGVQEVVRVLKPGGFGWLYVIENPGGLFWDVIEVLRVVMRGESKDVARSALRLLGLPANRVFYMLDHVMVPINIRTTPAEVEACLEHAGATHVRRLMRGADFDRVEQIYQRVPFAEVKFGVGENRYVFSKA